MPDIYAQLNWFRRIIPCLSIICICRLKTIGDDWQVVFNPVEIDMTQPWQVLLTWALFNLKPVYEISNHYAVVSLDLWLWHIQQ